MAVLSLLHFFCEELNFLVEKRHRPKFINPYPNKSDIDSRQFGALPVIEYFFAILKHYNFFHLEMFIRFCVSFMKADVSVYYGRIHKPYI